MKLGVHCVLFGPRIVEEAGAIFPQLAQSGAAGVEIGARFLSPETRETVMGAITQNGLVVAGYHVVATLGALAGDLAPLRQTLAEACAFLQGKPEKNIILTGMFTTEVGGTLPDERMQDAAFVAQVAAGAEALAAFVRQKGAVLHYHNHSWEFEHGALIYNTLLQKAPGLQMAMDIGWAQSSGYNVAAALAAYPGRFTYLHLRDYKTETVRAAKDFPARQNAYCDLGEGDAFVWPEMLPRLAAAVGKNGWLVVEYEKGEQDAARYNRALDFVRGILGES